METCHLPRGPGHERGHSPAGPQAPCLGHGAEPAGGFETHAAYDSVPDVLPMLGEKRGMAGPGQTHHLPTLWPHPVVLAFGEFSFSQGSSGYMTRIKAQGNIQQAQKVEGNGTLHGTATSQPQQHGKQGKVGTVLDKGD